MGLCVEIIQIYESETSHTRTVVHAIIVTLKRINSTKYDNFRDTIFPLVYSRNFRPPQHILYLLQNICIKIAKKMQGMLQIDR